MSERLISQLQSFFDRLKNDARSALMFEADADTLREAMARIKADGLRVDHAMNEADKDVIRIAALEAELAKVQDYATTLATSMHRQHYAEAAPNWQPLDDLMGLLTQIDNMYAGLRNDLADLEVESKRLVGMPLAAMQETRERAIAEVECLWMAIQNHCSAETIKAIESEVESK